MKFGRKASSKSASTATAPDPAAADQSKSTAATGAGTQGPFNVEDLNDDLQRVDLGALLVAPNEGQEVRLQVDESTGQVASVLLAGVDGAMELQVYAAPRGGDLWSEVLPQLEAELSSMGGDIARREGPFGEEIAANLPAQAPDGTPAIQPTRFVGVNGDRWLLRATFMGRPAVEEESAAAWATLLQRVAVRRGKDAMPVGRALPLKLPADARRVD